MSKTSPVIRVGDSEREVCISRLTTALVGGQLDQTEFDERAGAALHARTRDDLGLLTADLEDAALPVPHGRAPATARINPRLAGGFIAVSGVLCVLLLGEFVFVDVYTGVLLWLFSILSGGVGVLLAAKSHSKT